MLNHQDFYHNYYGHKVPHLQIVLNQLRKNNQGVVFLAGDSSLDNKYWLLNQSYYKPAINGWYNQVLLPPVMMPDISYHLNNLGHPTINCAVEESTIADRETNLLDQDCFIRDHITKDDTLVVSVGGNDIALKPTFQTIWNMFKLVYLNTTGMIDQGPSWITFGMNYFIDMFSNRTKEYIEKLITKTKPKRIIVCTIYYPAEATTGSWADKTLGLLGYNKNPEKLQLVIRKIYEHATSKISIDGVNVTPFPMFTVLNSKDTKDYVERVEPSEVGGQKIAYGLAQLIN